MADQRQPRPRRSLLADLRPLRESPGAMLIRLAFPAVTRYAASSEPAAQPGPAACA